MGAERHTATLSESVLLPVVRLTAVMTWPEQCASAHDTATKVLTGAPSLFLCLLAGWIPLACEASARPNRISQLLARHANSSVFSHVPLVGPPGSWSHYSAAAPVKWAPTTSRPPTQRRRPEPSFACSLARPAKVGVVGARGAEEEIYN